MIYLFILMCDKSENNSDYDNDSDNDSNRTSNHDSKCFPSLTFLY